MTKIISQVITAKPGKAVVLVNFDKPLLFVLSRYLFGYTTDLTPSIVHCKYPHKVILMVSALSHRKRGKAEKKDLAVT